jgi:hypothetical protein
MKLPPEVREEINRKLDSAWEYRSIRKWLFEQVAECDVPALELVKGDSYSLAWLRAAKSTEHAWHHCELALGNWFRTHHEVWLKLQVQGSESMRLVKRAGLLTREAVACTQESGGIPTQQASRPTTAGGASTTIEGGNVMMRSVLIDAISTIQGGSKDPKDIAQLANAWARLNQTNTEAEKLQLKTESAEEIAFEALGKEIRGMPETRELFKKLHEVFKREKAALPQSK